MINNIKIFWFSLICSTPRTQSTTCTHTVLEHRTSLTQTNNTMTNNEIKWKIGIIGEVGVGKTSLLLRYVDNTFSEESFVSIGADWKSKQVKFNLVTPVTLMIWDTAGQERFRSMTSSFYRGAQGIIAAFDVTDRDSFEKLDDWLNSLAVSVRMSLPMLLIGCKTDLPHRTVTFEEGKTYAEDREMLYTECSAKEGTGINEAFEALVTEIGKRTFPQIPRGNSRVDVHGHDTANSAKKKKSWNCTVI